MHVIERSLFSLLVSSCVWDMHYSTPAYYTIGNCLWKKIQKKQSLVYLNVILCLSEDILNLDTLLIVEAWWPHGWCT